MRTSFRERLRLTAATILPLVATVLTLAPIAGRARAGTGMVVFGAALCLTAARRGATVAASGDRGAARTPVRRLALMPVTVLAGVLVAGLFHVSLVLGDALFVATAVFATVGRAVGPRTVAVGRALLVPMLALFIAPVRLGPDPWRGIGWAAVAGAVALVWMLAAELLIVPRPDANGRGKGSTKASVHLRRAAHTGIGLTLAFAVGQVFFAQHWTWTVISAFTVGIGARSRGDVVLKAVQRVLGAAIGTVAAGALGVLVTGRPVLTVGLILAFLAAGTFLREVNYMWWALCLTAVLALLYALDGVTGSLGLRLLAIVAGGACAVLPAVFLKPIRTRALVRKRTGEAMRSIRDAMHDPAHLGRARADLAALRASAAPLRWIRARELSWVDDLTAAGDGLDTVDGRRAAAGTLHRIRAELTT